jgi:asparagine synthase (glutamine-hydrolysing)
MCGIFGRLRLLGGPLNGSLCVAQTDAMRHRGPDGSGYLALDSVSGASVLAHQGPTFGAALAGWGRNWDMFLGHRRLAVLDLSPQAAQPMGDPQGRYWLTYNGEIYNFLELKRELARLGASFRTEHSDTEVLLLALAQWGEACLARVRGMFAFGMVDVQEKTLFLARDRLGKKPLYYRATAQELQFASELKAIMADPATPREIDAVALGQYLMYGYIPAPRTIYRGIAKLPPGHCAWVNLARPQEIRLRRYWEAPAGTEAPERRDWQEEFEAELAEAVRLRLISDVPLGAFASGGLDSTLVVRQMQRVSREPIRTFAIGFAQGGINELPYARRVARHYHTEHTEEVVRPDALALLPEMVRQFDEPFGDSSAIPTWIVSQAARRHVTVALSGDGGDELFAGYLRYHNAHRLQRLLAAVPPGLRRPLLTTASNLWPPSWKGKSLLQRAGLLNGNLYRAVMARDANLALLHPEVRHLAVQSPELHAFFDEPWQRGPGHPVSRMQFTDLHSYLPEDVLVKADRASMAASLELRCPLLDHRVVELAARLPLDLKYRPGQQKFLVKQILLPDLGPEFVHRRKNGFQTPLRSWFQGDLRNLLQERLLARPSPLAGLCDGQAVRAMVHRFFGGQTDLSEDLWRLLVLAQWRRSVHQQRGG